MQYTNAVPVTAKKKKLFKNKEKSLWIINEFSLYNLSQCDGACAMKNIKEVL